MAKKLDLSNLSLTKEGSAENKIGATKPPIKTEKKVKVPITYNIEPTRKKQLQKLALELDTDMTKLLDEAVDLLFVEHNWK